MKRTNRQPFIFRLMLLSVFLPIFIVSGIILVHTIMDKTFWQDQLLLLNGIPARWIGLFFETLPLFLGIWLFWKGRWRLPVFVAGTLYLSFILLTATARMDPYIPPEKRTIHVDSGSYENNSVYCNGVYLGQTPLEIRVDELKAKVPEWTSPPEQRFYGEDTVQHYIWFPWDNFRKERFLEVKELFDSTTRFETLTPAVRKEQLERYYADCRYWWRFENNKSQLVVQQKNSSPFRDVSGSFEKTENYSFSPNKTFSPSAAIHAWLLAQVLAELTEPEKNDWDKHVLKHWSLLCPSLNKTLLRERSKYPNDHPSVKKIETALDSVARLKYGLSDPPTEEECRRLLTNWVQESFGKRPPFAMNNNYINPPNTWSGKRVYLANNEAILIDAAIKLMGETVRKPLAEQWKKNYYRFEKGWDPLLYVSGIDGSKEYFDEMVCYAATTHNGQFELLKNQNEQVVPLFRTILYHKNFLDLVKPNTKRYQQSIIDPIIFYSDVDNPLLDTIFREYIVHVLSDPKLQRADNERLNLTIVEAISRQLWRVKEEEFNVWITSLPLDQTSKDLLFRKYRIHHGGTYHGVTYNVVDESAFFSACLQSAAGHEVFIETKKTLGDVHRWFAENLDGTLSQFFKIFANDFELRNGNNVPITPKADTDHLVPVFSSDGNFVWNTLVDNHLPRYLVTVLLRTTTPETQKTIKQLCNNQVDREIVLAAIMSEFSSRAGDNGMFSSEYSYYSFIGYPDYILDIFERLNEEEMSEISEIVSELMLCPSPRAEQILEKWSQTENKFLKQKITHSLKVWQQRKMIREQNKKLFYELVEEKIMPDDLLVPQTPWVWKDGKYVH
ncbi:MAG: hypothetical protein LBF88_03780 [Planctomycetaceae bacterium]|jgi:hypothetical protein|nr:hypothetical protein [Planctomycetaceae bacterium]